ncbi:MAG: hypothetical protein ABH843_06825 [Candidatus Omnitrophota bacterium]
MQEQNIALPAASLDIKKCFKDALEVYKPNVLMLALAAFLSSVISLLTLFILAAPIVGGYFYMMLSAMRKEDKKIELQDMFSMFKIFWPLFGLFWMQGLLIVAGSFFFIIPGIFLATVWMFSTIIMVDRSEGIMPSLKMSWNVIMKNGFWLNFALIIIYMSLNIVPSYIPFIGLFATFFVSPFAVLLLISAYIQQVPKEASA